MPTQNSRSDYHKRRRLEARNKLQGIRRCLEDGCGTILNRYNFNKCCSLHNFEYIKRTKDKGDI